MTTYLAQVTPMNIQLQGAENFPNVPGWIDSMTLAANTAASYSLATLRTNAALKQKNIFVILAADGPFWMNPNGTAAIPSTNETDGGASIYCPTQFYVDTVEGIANLSFIAAATTHISISVYEP